MAKCKVIRGLTDKTAQRLILDAGAFFKNYNFESPDDGTTPADTFETAVTAGKLLGATKGGGSFKAVPNSRQIEVDGMRGAVKGMSVIDSWDVSIGVNIVEFKPETIKDMLGAGSIDESGDTHDVITGNMCSSDDDYIDNITWIGNLLGTETLVVIQIYNALNTSGINISMNDKGETSVATEFVAHFKEMTNVTEAPFKIYFPKVS